MYTQHIPLDKLVPGKANVRKTAPDLGIPALAANIEAIGLLQNLAVRPYENDKFGVEAGMRRFRALKLLAKQKVIAKTEPIACNVLEEGKDPGEISLAENVLREPMHPADQFEAFQRLAEVGKGPEEIAARFGCSALTVRQRLKLATVSPALLAAYRQDGMTLDQLMAFTVSDDHAAQETVWRELPDWNRHPATIRRNLTHAHVEASDHRVSFVGIDAYLAASGGIIRDLFAEEHAGYLTDPGLLDRLCAERLEREAEALRAEGWKWVEIAAAIDHSVLQPFRRIYPETDPIGEAEQAEVDRLSRQYDDLAGEHGDEPPEAIAAELERISDAIDALSQGKTHWLPEGIARAGAIVGIGFGGRLAVERGLLRPEDAPENDRAPQRTRRTRGGTDRTAQSGELPAPLVEDLTAHRTAALRATLAENPEIALVAVVHALALKHFYGFGLRSCIAITSESANLRGSAEGIEDSPAARKLAEQEARWRDRLPEASEELWGWLIERDPATRLDLLAYCAASSVNAVVKPHEQFDSRLDHADQLASALSLDMREWWQPTRERYLDRVSKARILEAVAEGVSAEAAENLAKLKKDALAKLAEERLAGTGWLPRLLCASAATATPQPEIIAA